MENNFEQPLVMTCRPSRRIAILQLFMHAGAAAAVIQAAIPDWASACLVIALAGLCGRLLFAYCHAVAQPPQTLVLSAGDQWLLRSADGTVRELRQAGPVFTHPWLVVLQLAPADGACHTFLFTPDNCAAELLRRIRVRLRFPTDHSMVNDLSVTS